MSGVQFPESFQWGAATSAYQIEGAADVDGRRPSIWDEFCRLPGAIEDGRDGSVAIDHYHRYREDVALMRELGLRSYRFSVCWPRVMDGSDVNKAGMDFYSRLVDELLEADIAPWLTLYHWDLPASLPGGWTSRDTAHRFAEYAVALHERLGDRVRTWTTLNEPWCSAFMGYGSGEHAPGHTDPRQAVRAVHHLLLGHGLATEALRTADPEATLGLTLNFTPALAASDDPADLDVVRRINGTANRVFVHPVFTGDYPEDVRADLAPWWDDDLVRDGDMATIASPVDVLGVNYYSTTMYRADGQRPGPQLVRGRRRETPHISAPEAAAVLRGLPQTAMGWEVEPDGLRRLLEWLHHTYTGPAGVPLVITENGSAYDDVPSADGTIADHDRIEYLRDHLHAVHRAISNGVDVRGYLLWSLIDNFEWAFGYTKHFGIYAVDDGLRRLPKASAEWYGSVARTGTVQ